MANEINKEEIKQSSDANIRALQNIVEGLPRTDHMTLPAIQITEIDPETRTRLGMIADINKSKNDEDVIGKEGRTRSQIRNEFMYGVSDLSEEGAKHQLVVNEGEEGRESVTIIAPVIEVTNADGEVEETQAEELTIEATPANIAPIDKDAPHDPVEARTAAGLAEDGSEGQPVDGPAQPRNIPGTPYQPGVTYPTANPDLGSQGKIGGAPARDVPAPAPPPVTPTEGGTGGTGGETS